MSKGLQPPIGIEPEFIHKENRLICLRDAMVRRLNVSNKTDEYMWDIPIEWVTEYNELIKYLDNRVQI